MSATTERILIAILLIIAVVFATRDAHSGDLAAQASDAKYAA
jgi:hypothetical protein